MPPTQLVTPPLIDIQSLHAPRTHAGGGQSPPYRRTTNPAISVLENFRFFLTPILPVAIFDTFTISIPAAILEGD